VVVLNVGDSASPKGEETILNVVTERNDFKIKDLRKPESTKLPAFSLKPYFW